MNTQHSKDMKKDDTKSSSTKDGRRADDKSTASRSNGTDKKSDKDSKKSPVKK